jgi:hypothetical protein
MFLLLVAILEPRCVSRWITRKLMVEEARSNSYHINPNVIVAAPQISLSQRYRNIFWRPIRSSRRSKRAGLSLTFVLLKKISPADRRHQSQLNPIPRGAYQWRGMFSTSTMGCQWGQNAFKLRSCRSIRHIFILFHFDSSPKLPTNDGRTNYVDTVSLCDRQLSQCNHTVMCE